MRNRKTKLKWKQIMAIVLSLALVFVYYSVFTAVTKSRNDKKFNHVSSDFSSIYGKLDTVFDVEQKFITAISSKQIFIDFLKRYSEPTNKYSSEIDIQYHVNDAVSIAKDEDLRKELNSQMFLSKYTVDMAISRISDGHTITRSITTDIDSYLKQFGMQANIVDETFSSRETSFKLCELFPIPGRQGNLMLVYKVSAAKNMSAYVFMNIDISSFLNMHEDSDGLIAIVKDGKTVASNYPASQVKQEEIQTLISKYNIENDHEKNTLYDTHRGFAFFVKDSESCPGYKYICYVDVSDNSSMMMAIHVFAVLLLIMVGIFLSYLIDRYLSMPIGRLISLFDAREKGSLRLSYMIDEVENVMLTNKNLRKLLDEHSGAVREKFLLDCAKGIVGDAHIEEFLNKYEYPLLCKECVCSVFICQVQSIIKDVTDDEWIKIKNVIFDVLNEKLGSMGEFINSDFLEFLYIAECKNIELFVKNLSNILIDLEMKYDIRVNAAISNSFRGLENLHNAYSQAQYAKAYQFFSDGAYCTTYSGVHSKKNKGVRYPINIEKNLIDAVLNNSLELARKTLSGILQENVFDNELSDNDIGEFIFTITGTIKRIVGQINKKEEEIFGEGFVVYLEIKSCQTRRELANKINEIFEMIYTSMKKTNITSGSRIADEVIEYIDNNYQIDLALSDVCEHFSLSLSYVSRVLREHKNTSFKTYLMQKRIEVAKEIMKDNKHIKIADLAQQVGYLNTLSFIRVFKNLEGISPGAFLKGLE